MITVGLLGAGRIGQVHAKSIGAHKGSRLVAVADVNEEAAKSLATASDAEARTVEAILADSGVDAVLIATSTDTHSDLIEAAIAAGKAVLCEKPVDLSLDRARGCLAAVEAAGRDVMVGFNRRFDPNFAALKSAFDAGEIGKGELFTVTSYDPAPPPMSYIEVSGGLFRDMAIHDFDLVGWVMGGAPDWVSAKGVSIVDPAIGAAGDVDTAVTTLGYADGRLAVVKNSRRAVFGYDQRLELLGAEGLLSADNILENSVTKATAAGVSGAKPTYFFLERYMRAYEIEWAAFAESVEAGTPPPITLKEGVDALAIAEAATRSAQTGETIRMADI